MKKFKYFWARRLLTITGIVFVTQLIVELIATRKEGFEWILPACGIAFTVSIVYAIILILLNSWYGRK